MSSIRGESPSYRSHEDTSSDGEEEQSRKIGRRTAGEFKDLFHMKFHAAWQPTTED